MGDLSVVGGSTDIARDRQGWRKIVCEAKNLLRFTEPHK